VRRPGAGARLVHARVHGAHEVGGSSARAATLVVHRPPSVAAAQVARHRQVRCAPGAPRQRGPTAQHHTAGFSV
jgi:hypothetical protein